MKVSVKSRSGKDSIVRSKGVIAVIITSDSSSPFAENSTIKQLEDGRYTHTILGPAKFTLHVRKGQKVSVCLWPSSLNHVLAPDLYRMYIEGVDPEREGTPDNYHMIY